MAIKGQNLRVFVGGKCIAAATSCTLHLSADVQDSSTKDSGDWTENESVGKSWDVSTESLVVLTDPVSGGDAKSSVDLIGMIGTTVALVFDQTSGTNNRTGENATIKKSGNAILADASISAQNRQNSTLSCQFTGTGALS